MRTLALARFTFQEAVRRRVVVAAAGLGVIFLALFALGTHFAVRELETSLLILPSVKPFLIAQLLLTGMWISSLASSMLAIFSASGTISAEVENGTLQAIASKPLRRGEIVLGKWLGLAGVAVLYSVTLTVGVIIIVWAAAGYAGSSPLIAIGALAVQTLVLLSLTILGSSLFPSLAAGIGVFMLHAIAMAAGIQEQLGFALKNQTMQDAGIWVSLIIPSDAMEKLAAAALQNTMGATLAMPGPFSVLAPPSPWMVAYAGLYCAVCLLLAIVRFDGQDL